ncbi:substrate of the Dot/Icm secretion system [Legionella sainthelensi]|uniref:Substrate of the Dot/Icm secretion system n=1 Tax=Legionella sainthelensi TaxID=28087 RepID=A0A0W0YJM6_9GAMM|nr:hypothetical protein [Legionella sainthelensi]KTD56879.1 substrate of the Dot/Icm secretion system [Legionella sainthelensi]VEH37127.1 substrate of the Dot/Icm secretion system [Legionella sainthelensi]
MNPEDIRLFFQTYYTNHFKDPLLFESRNQERGDALQIVSSTLSKNDAEQVAKRIKMSLPLAEVGVVASRNIRNQFRAIILNPVKVYEVFLKNEDKIRTFFQTLYNKSTNSQLQFECRNRFGVYGQKQLGIVSPALSEHDAQQMVEHLKKVLPASAKVEVVDSLKTPGQYRAVIINSEEVFGIYVKRMVDMLNRFHPIPSDPKRFGMTHFWTSPCTTFIAYKTNIASLYHSDSMDPKIRVQALEEIHKFNAHIEKLFPGFEIRTEHHRHGDVYLIENFSYVHYVSLQQQLKLKDLGILFFSQNQDRYKNSKAELTEDLQEDIEFINRSRKVDY